MTKTPIVRTFSIVACDLDEKSWGVAVASKFLAVGAVVPFAKAGVGAIATQSEANMAYGEQGLSLMAQGLSASEALNRLVSEDTGRDHRQAGVVDRQGGAATYTGAKCYDWAGGIAGKNFAAQGNILTGEATVTAMAEAFEKSSGELADRLCAALAAGDSVGGDRRGKQSAALLVVKPNGSYGGYTDKYIDLRVDDHKEPVTELANLLKMHHVFFGSSRSAQKIKIEGELAKQFLVTLQRLGYYDGEPETHINAEAKIALIRFIGVENLEERFDAEQMLIDEPALDYLRKRLLGAA